ncbi:MAG: hypothetical protein WBW88_16240, partial [Rhodothermales bacterium]
MNLDTSSSVQTVCLGRLRLGSDAVAPVAHATYNLYVPGQALALYDELASNPKGEIERATADWNAELKALFTPNNDRYSGHLPEIETSDEDIRKLYWMGACGVAYFKRDSPHSVMGRTYDTLMPKYWQTVTFLWDYFLSSGVHAQLDPDVMKKYLEHW